MLPHCFLRAHNGLGVTEGEGRRSLVMMKQVLDKFAGSEALNTSLFCFLSANRVKDTFQTFLDEKLRFRVSLILALSA